MYMILAFLTKPPCFSESLCFYLAFLLITSEDLRILFGISQLMGVMQGLGT